MSNVVAFPSPDGARAEAWELVCETPAQLLEIQQHVAPTHRRVHDTLLARPKHASRPPLALDPVDAIVAEEQQVVYWSGLYGATRGTVGQRVMFLAHMFPDIPDWDIDNLLEQWRPIRAAHRRLWPTGHIRLWLTEREAAELVGKTVQTLRLWRNQNPNLCRRTEGGTEYHRTALQDMADDMKEAATQRIQAVTNPQAAS